MTKLEDVYAKIRTLHAQIGQARGNACDREVDNNLRHVADALELEFPEAFLKTPHELADEILKKMRPLPQEQQARIDEARTSDVWTTFLKAVEVHAENEYRAALRMYKETGVAVRLAHAIHGLWLFHQMLNMSGEYQNIEMRFRRDIGVGVEPEQTPGPGFSLIECEACERYYVRSNARGRTWDCVCGADEKQIENLMVVPGPERELTGVEADAYLSGRRKS